MSKETQAVIVGAARTPVGGYLGSLKELRASELGQIALNKAIEEAGIQKTDIDEIVTGSTATIEVNGNISRVIGLNAGLPQCSTAYTINQLCGSGYQAIISASKSIQIQDKKVIAAGGAESVSRSPYMMDETSRFKALKAGNKPLIDVNLYLHEYCGGEKAASEGVTHMGVTAENLAEKYSISREEQDRFALESQNKTITAMENGNFDAEIAPVKIVDRKGNETIIDKDETPRPGLTMEKLGKLKPVFRRDGKGTVTAGNACGLNDGAAFEIVTSEAYAEENNLEIMAKVKGYATVGCDPRTMGIGPVGAIKEVLAKNNLKIEDIAYLDINEAFAAQVIACLKELGIEEGSEVYKRLNPNGGAIALGHPYGMTGARVVATAVHHFKRNPQDQYAIVSACIGGGQGIAILLENGYTKKANY